MTKKPALIDPVPYQQIMKAYNEAVAGTPLPKCIAMTAKRREKLQSRWEEPLFRERYAEVFRKAVQIPWLRGECPSPGHEGWTGSFDYFIRNDTNYVDVLERPIAKPKTVGPPGPRDLVKLLPNDYLVECREDFEEFCKSGYPKEKFTRGNYRYEDLMAEWIRRGLVKEKGA